VLMRRWSVKDAVALILQHKVTTIGGVPAITTAIMQSPLLPKDYSIKVAAYGGAPCQDRLAADVRTRWPEATPGQGWGMTEVTVLHCSTLGTDYLEKPKSTGPPVPVCDVRIIDPETKKEVPVGTVGTILARGPNIMKCYIGNESESRLVWRVKVRPLLTRHQRPPVRPLTRTAGSTPVMPVMLTTRASYTLPTAVSTPFFFLHRRLTPYSQGHHHPRRGEHLVCRGRERHLPGQPCCRMCCCPRAARCAR
jgi:acyl-CoA synthetase (AMP-forming)/AMP-acid ligase II